MKKTLLLGHHLTKALCQSFEGKDVAKISTNKLSNCFYFSYYFTTCMYIQYYEKLLFSLNLMKAF